MSNRESFRDRSPARRDHRDNDRNRRDENGGRGRSPERDRSFRDRDARDDRRDTRDYRSDDRDRRDRDDRDRRDSRRSRSRSPVRSRDEKPNNRGAAASAPIINNGKPAQTTALDRAKSKAALEQARKERIALLKNITGGDQFDEDKPKEKRVRREEGGEGIGEKGESEGEEEEDMMEMLGFSGFNTTKGKQVADNELGAAAGAVSKHRKRQYRQYMNRKGGFNRPLQKID